MFGQTKTIVEVIRLLCADLLDRETWQDVSHWFSHRGGCWSNKMPYSLSGRSWYQLRIVGDASWSAQNQISMLWQAIKFVW